MFVPAYTIDNVTYSSDPTKTNEITISSVLPLIVKGSFVINLVDPISEKTIKIVGEFSAIGTTEEK